MSWINEEFNRENVSSYLASIKPKEENKELLTTSFTEEDYKLSYNIDHKTIEMLLIGYLIKPPHVEKADSKAADLLVDSGIEAEWFENQGYGNLYNSLIQRYIDNRTLLGIEDSILICQNEGQTPDDIDRLQLTLNACMATVISWKIMPQLVIDRFITKYYDKTTENLFVQYTKDRANTKIGYKNALNAFKEKLEQKTLDKRGAVLKETDFINNGTKLCSWIRDMKVNPDKYKGINCGINAIDNYTGSFRAGQLTVFVAPPGGFKTTLMLNACYGSWNNGANALYLSLEMENNIVSLKLLCRGTSLINFAEAYKGKWSEPSDNPDAMKKVQDLIQQGRKEEADEILNKYDSVIAENFYKRLESKPNKLKIINSELSQKIKLSHLERWLLDHVHEFKPNIVFLDYLALVDPEKNVGDNYHLAFGQICKMARRLGSIYGFSIVTAAQLKRAAIERIRKYGIDQIDKVQLGTDDISDSNQIGADADNVGIIIKKDDSKLLLFWTKSRHIGSKAEGVGLEVNHNYCLITDENQMQAVQSKIQSLSFNKSIQISNDPKPPELPEVNLEEKDVKPNINNSDNTDWLSDEIINTDDIQTNNEDADLGDFL